VGRAFKAELRSIDVLHNFAVPQFRAKMDLIPGSVTFVWFTPIREGRFDLLCNELCGVAHYAMRGKVVVEDEQTFQAWLRGYPTFAETMARAPGDVVVGRQLYATCAACHGAQGEGNRQLNAPKLAGLEDWYMRRQLKYFKEGARGTHQQDTFGKLMAPMAATLADDAAIANVSAYIVSLPDKPAPHTVSGNAEDGRRLFVTTCGACHGPQGQGSAATNAPRLAGMSDWYLVTQLGNFRQGVRGTHPHDLYGPQMGLLSANLTSKQAINDLVAYVNSLR
jgi:cytochrome c oxidase subunit 2